MQHNKTKHLNRFSLKLVIVIVGFLLFSLIIAFISKRVDGDDVYFSSLTSQYSSLADWLVYRYTNWSARLLPEVFIYYFSSAPLIYWKMATVCVFIVVSGQLALFYELFKESIGVKVHRAIDCSMYTVFLSIPYLMGLSVFSDSVLWVTGAMNYFWIVPVILMSLYPALLFGVRRTFPSPLIMVLSFMATVLACASSEQGSILIFSVYVYVVVSNLKSFIKKENRSDLLKLIFFLVLSIGGMLYLLLAPGNEIRTAREYESRMPGVESVSLIDRLNSDIRWFIDATINHSGVVILSLLIVLVVLLYKKNRNKAKNKAYFSLMTLMSAGIVMHIMRSQQFVEAYLFNFAARYKGFPDHFYVYVIVFFWLAVLISTVIAPWYIFKFKDKKYAPIFSFLVLISYGLVALMWFSPTMYASGWRTLFIPLYVMSITCLGLLLFVFKEVKDIQHKAITPITALLVCIGALYLSYLVHVVLVGF